MEVSSVAKTQHKSKTEARLIRGVRTVALTKVSQVAPKDAKRLAAA